MRFYAHSETDPDATHIVDLMENGGHGECSCEDWMYRKNKARRKGETSYDKNMCKHMRAAHIWNSIKTVKSFDSIKGSKPVKVRKSLDGLPF